MRDPTAPPPTGNDWVMEFRPLGFSDAQAMLLSACLSPNADERPADASVLADLIDKNTSPNAPSDGGSKTFQLKGTSRTQKPLPLETPKPAPVRMEHVHPPTGDPVNQPRVFQNSLGIQFTLIPAGTFMMGSTEEEKGHHTSEAPLHKVTISRPFYLSIFPVTQAQYRALTGKNPSHFQRTLGGGPDHPVEQVTWDEAAAFCEQLQRLPEESARSRLYRLPTEAEWEYACRSGTSTPYAFGDSVTLQQVHFFGLDSASWKKEVTSVGKTQKVGSHPPNGWGLYDMHGNVLEWCSDWWSEEYYADSPDTDPQGPAEGWQHVVRGGSFSQFEKECRSAARMGRAPSSRLNTIGFRVALTIPGS
jgi:formylglycine-generating enzyme required for sulfatase activity